MELCFLAALSREHRSLVPDGQPTVIEIIVAQCEKHEEEFSSDPQ
jgi:hypothetical protein